MEQILTKQGTDFKVHNTWDLFDKWENGGEELYFNKLQKKLKSILKEGTDLCRVKRSYFEQTDDVYWFCYETNDITIKVSLRMCGNMNHGTWFSINEIKFV